MRIVLLAAVAAVSGTGAIAQGLDLPFQTNRELRTLDDTQRATTDTSEAAGVAEAEDRPLLRADFPETEAIPGQFLTLRLTALVPSFMPEPPVWPSFEMPNVLVRVPEGATNPTSERIGGATWSGISRRYLISPMVPGAFNIPPQYVVVTWADPGADQPQQFALSTGPLAFEGVLPEDAQGLDPFVAAVGLTLTQEIVGDPGALAPGDSVTRSVTVEVSGVSPMFVPKLLEPVAVPGLAAYADEPRFTETDDRGILGGTRTESVTYVAEAGGGGTLPAVAIDWWNIGSRRVESAMVEAVDIAIDGPPAVLADRGERRRFALFAAGLLAFGLLAALGLRLAWRHMQRRLAARRAARLASEAHAWRALMQVMARKDHAALYPALCTWAMRTDGEDPRNAAAVQTALVALGRGRYGPCDARSASNPDAWGDLRSALHAVRRRPGADARRGALPDLNPGATT